MRLLPPPWEGIAKPGRNEGPAPFPTYPAIHFAPLLGSLVGFSSLPVAKLLSISPLYGAGCASLASLLLTSYTTFHTVREQRKTAVKLKQEGYIIPRRKLFDRWSHLDAENVLLLGGLVGVLVASRRPAAWARAGWRKAARYGAAYSYGVAFATVGLQITPLPGFVEAQSAWQIRQQELNSRDAAIHAATIPMLGYENPAVQGADFGYTHESNKVMELIKDLMGGDEGDEEARAALLKKWSEDPKPHEFFGTMDENGNLQRDFFPARNLFYLNLPDAEAGLEKHLQFLIDRRQRLSDEAEVMWRKGSQSNNDWWKAVDEGRRADALEGLSGIDFNFSKENVRMTYAKAVIVNNLHSRLWEEISRLDWIIADTKRQMLELQARRKGTTWEPKPVKDQEDIPLNMIRTLVWQQYSAKWAELTEVLLPRVEMLIERREELRSEMPRQVVDSPPGSHPARQELDQVEGELQHTQIIADSFFALGHFLVDLGASDLAKRLSPLFDPDASSMDVVPSE